MAVKRVNRLLEWSELAFATHSSKTEDEAELGRKGWVLEYEEFLVHDGEKVAYSKISSQLVKWKILDKALLSKRQLFKQFGMHILQKFETVLRKRLMEDRVYKRESKTTLTSWEVGIYWEVTFCHLTIAIKKMSYYRFRCMAAIIVKSTWSERLWFTQKIWKMVLFYLKVEAVEMQSFWSL